MTVGNFLEIIKNKNLYKGVYSKMKISETKMERLYVGVFLVAVLVVIFIFTVIYWRDDSDDLYTNNDITDNYDYGGEDLVINTVNTSTSDVIEEIPDYSGEPWVIVNNNVPYFSESEITTDSFESYSSLDALGRCGVCWASIGADLMPADGEGRGDISTIKPSGWVNAKYDFVKGGYVYNRCHLIGWQLTAENANKENLITGTRYMNIDGMLPFENLVADYIKDTGNHVMYRVTPDFVDDELVCRGVLMEGYSVEDNGDGIFYCVYCYNVQPGVSINYMTGETKAE